MNKYYMILLCALFISVSVEAAEPSFLDNRENLQVATYFKDFATPESIEAGKDRIIAPLNDQFSLVERFARSLKNPSLDQAEASDIKGDISKIEREIDVMQKALAQVYEEAYQQCLSGNKALAYLFLTQPVSLLGHNTSRGAASLARSQEIFTKYFLPVVEKQSPVARPEAVRALPALEGSAEISEDTHRQIYNIVIEAYKNEKEGKIQHLSLWNRFKNWIFRK